MDMPLTSGAVIFQFTLSCRSYKGRSTHFLELLTVLRAPITGRAGTSEIFVPVKPIANEVTRVDVFDAGLVRAGVKKSTSTLAPFVVALIQPDFFSDLELEFLPQ